MLLFCFLWTPSMSISTSKYTLHKPNLLSITRQSRLRQICLSASSEAVGSFGGPPTAAQAPGCAGVGAPAHSAKLARQAQSADAAKHSAKTANDGRDFHRSSRAEACGRDRRTDGPPFVRIYRRVSVCSGAVWVSRVRQVGRCEKCLENLWVYRM